MVYHNFATIKDYKIFPNRTIKKDGKPFEFPESEHPRFPKSIKIDSLKEIELEAFLKEEKTVAFLIIQNDSIQYEHYFDDYNDSSIVASFSMSKSVLSMLVGIAVDEGYINSVDDPIKKYIPDLKNEELQQTTIHQLLQMTSGLKFNESYLNPFGHAAAFYYGRNLRKKSSRLKIEKNTAHKFAYKSGNSQLLGLVLDNALPEEQTISGYLEEKIWQPLHMEYDATWNTDDQKEKAVERTFCCLNGRTRDFAKLGRLYLNKGKFKDQQIIPEQWVKQSTKIDTTDGSSWKYQYHWWLPTKEGDFMADGLLGQYIYVHPDKNLIMVRLGKNRKEDWQKILPKLAAFYD